MRGTSCLHSRKFPVAPVRKERQVGGNSPSWRPQTAGPLLSPFNAAASFPACDPRPPLLASPLSIKTDFSLKN